MNTATAGSAQNTTFDAAAASGVKEIWADGYSGSTNSNEDTFIATGIDTDVVLGIKEGDGEYNVTGVYNDVSGTADDVSIALQDADVDTVTVAGVETVSVAEAGDTAASDIDALTIAAAETLTIDADGKGVKVSAVTGSANLATVDASASTQDVDINVDAAGSDVTFSGGAGDDKVTFGTNNTFTKDDSVTGGAGNDTLGVHVDEAVTTDAFSNIEGFENLEIAGATSDGDTIELDHWNGISNVSFLAAATATTTVESLANDATIGLAAASGVDLNVEDDTTNDSLNLDLNGGAVTYTVDASDVENLNVNTDDASGKSTLALTNTDLESVILTQSGTDQAFVFSTALGPNVSVVDLSGFEASTASKGVTVALSTTALTGATVTGSGQADVITGSAKADTINAGDGDDTIKVANGNALSVDTVDGGDGTDVIEITTDATTDIDDADFVNVSNVETFTLADGANTAVLGENAKSAGIVNVNGGGGVDTVTLHEDVTSYTTNAGDDVITLDKLYDGGLTITIDASGFTGVDTTLNLANFQDTATNWGTAETSASAVDAADEFHFASGVLTVYNETEVDGADIGAVEITIVGAGNGVADISGTAGSMNLDIS